MKQRCFLRSFSYNSKQENLFPDINRFALPYLNTLDVSLGNDISPNTRNNFSLQEFEISIATKPNELNNFDFLPKNIFLKLENYVDSNSEHLSNDKRDIDGTLHLVDTYSYNYQGEIQQTYRYILTTPITGSLSSNKISISLWLFDDRTNTTNSSSDPTTSSNSLVINAPDINKVYTGQIPFGMNGFNILAYTNTSGYSGIGNGGIGNILIDSYNFTCNVNINGLLKILISSN